MDKLEVKLDLIADDVKEVKKHVIELVAKGAVHNQILLEHEKRSTQLETILMPISETYNFMAKLCAVVVSILGVLATMSTIYYYAKPSVSTVLENLKSSGQK